MTEGQTLYVWTIQLPGRMLTFCIAQGISQEEAIGRILNRVSTRVTSDPGRLEAIEHGLRLQPHPIALVDGVALLGVQLEPE
jgi:hypothetical protein